ncbi:hypothetical protein GW932_04260 [archaeon]|nr:hypothetical protein [archaeon]
MFWLFTNKKRVDEIKEDTKKGFESVKKDILSVTEWIKHLDSEKIATKKEIMDIKSTLSNINEEIEGIKNTIDMMNVIGINTQNKQVFKTNSQALNKQTDVQINQTSVQTGVQTPNLSNFSIMERAIIGILLNSELKLSYEDIAIMLNKEKSTIRGQINMIKSKSESLIKEIIEKSGKKRVYIPKETKEKLLKKNKVSIEKEKKKEMEENE